MFKRKPALVSVLVVAVVGAFGPGACGPVPPPPGTGGTAGTPGTGGTGGVTGPMGCNADSVAGGAGVAVTTTTCPDAPAQELPLDSFPPCTGMAACESAHCIPKTLLTSAGIPEYTRNLLGVCADPSSLCVPDNYAKPFGRFKPKTCTSLGNAEGRCISTCIPQINGLMDVLPKADCGTEEVCAPCYHPVDGSVTHACDEGCDVGPSATTSQNPYKFQTCQGTGTCAPTNVVPPVMRTHLVQYECPLNHLCVPAKKASDLKYNFPSCAPTNPFVQILGGVGPNGQLGGCVPSWLVDSNLIETVFMTQDTCSTGEKCAPCNSPLRGFVPTAACAVPLCSDPSGGRPPGVAR
ncbi:MAG TPA: hypothetical protein VK524_21060 [Polyangiaceae bacterium]|nr:hypothetical protein [Polyangiaceae bacterium]